MEQGVSRRRLLDKEQLPFIEIGYIITSMDPFEGTPATSLFPLQVILQYVDGSTNVKQYNYDQSGSDSASVRFLIEDPDNVSSIKCKIMNPNQGITLTPDVYIDFMMYGALSKVPNLSSAFPSAYGHIVTDSSRLRLTTASSESNITVEKNAWLWLYGTIELWYSSRAGSHSVYFEYSY